MTIAATASMAESTYTEISFLVFVFFFVFLPETIFLYNITLQIYADCMFVRGDTFKHCVQFCIKKNS